MMMVAFGIHRRHHLSKGFDVGRRKKNSFASVFEVDKESEFYLYLSNFSTIIFFFFL